MEGIMEGIARYDVNEEWAHSGMIRAGDFCFLNYCAGNVGGETCGLLFQVDGIAYCGK